MKFSELISKTNNELGDNTNVVYILIEHLSKYNNEKIFEHIDDEIDFDLNIFNQYLEEYKKGKPIQHIVGYEWFFGRKIYCGDGAFIPRAETEQLCDVLIEICHNRFGEKKLSIADIGTGSGAIALTLCLELNAHIHATEISPEAINIAKNNFEYLGANITIIEGNMLDPLIEKKLKFDVVVSNPPYIKEGDETLEQSVIDYDPSKALWGGKDGLNFYREILKNVNKITYPGSIIAFEFGWDQKETLESIVQNYYDDYKFVKDFSGKWRMLFIFRKK